MSELPPDHDDAEVDALYRRMSAADPSQPGEGVRLAVLAYATRRAAQAASNAAVVRPEYSWQRRRAWARPAAFGALAAGILAAFMLGPRFTNPPQVPAPAAMVERAAGAPPVYADLGSAQPSEEERPPGAIEPDAKVGRVPRNAPRRQLTLPAPAEVASNNAAAVAAPARAEAADRMSAGSAKADAAPARAAPQAAASGRAAQAGLPEDSGAALWRAAESGDLAALRDLRQQHANLDATDAAGRTALMIATLHGHSQAVAALLDYGADPNIADARGVSPLDAALAADESEIIIALKRHGAR